jgi:hypothetical protein
MKLRLTKIIASTCTAFTMSMTIGCGDLPESPAGANLPIGSESSAQSYPNANFNLDLNQSDERPTVERVVDDNQLLEAIETLEGPADWPTLAANDQLGEGFANGITGNTPAEEDQDEEDNPGEDAQEEPENNGFADGYATSREWKDVAWSICNDDESELTGFKVANEADSGLYRATRFACTYTDESKDASTTVDYAAFVLGSATSCKTYEAFKAQAESICGTETEIVQKKVFNLCAESGGVSFYQSALFSCRKPVN